MLYTKNWGVLPIDRKALSGKSILWSLVYIGRPLFPADAFEFYLFLAILCKTTYLGDLFHFCFICFGMFPTVLGMLFE
jgi:hypothetical protein